MVEHLDIAVINLNRRPDRMTYLYKHIPISFRRSVAVDGQNLSNYYFEFPDLLETIRGQQRILGEVGCSLSHYSLWKAHAEKPNDDFLLVFEDDVMLVDRSLERLRLTIRDIQKGSAAAADAGLDFDVMYVGGQWTPDYDIDGETCPYFPFQKTTRESLNQYYRESLEGGIHKRRNLSPAVIQGNRNVWFSPLFRTAGAYIVSQRGAKRLLEAVQTDTALFMKTPLDMWLLEMDFRGYIDAFDRFPHPFYQAGFDLVKEGIANSQYDKCFKIDLWANTTNFIKADV
jgi:GR25 family glycosyltransferase involved in LPS biosynthesis